MCLCFRCRTIFTSLGLADFTKVNIEAIGSENNYGPLSALPQGTRECALWLAVHHQDQKALNIMAREIAPAGTGMAPGLTAIVGGRPKVSPVLKLFSFLHDKDTFKIDISMNGEHLETYTPAKTVSQSNKCSRPAQLIASISNACKGSHSYRLEDLAYTRSGDKGNNCNIGVVARHPAYLPYLKAALTEQSLAQYFSHLMEDTDWAKKVTRYDCPGIHALNFVLHNSLGGGGIASLRSDPQGKAYGQMLLDFQLHNMPSLEDLRT
ncbi:hypothetical protein DPMN_097138 [Dreissena polymorpha]|uniref:Terpene utilization protein AtuA n=1 Tax=Dreissena polymorpha TaxID=45954 RepID=A0A9D4R555_DREPO|nr:hypothetical protein DPMN_097138 [Dreissena polymorpha]